MDRASILGDAIQYIVELQQEVKKLQDEVNMEQEDCNMKDAELKRSSRYSPATTEHNRGSSSIREKKQIESQRVQVEVKLIGTREFLLKLLCEQKRGGFARLMEAINVLGLQVVDANITTFNGNVLNIFRVEAREIRMYIEIHWDEKKKRASCDSENEAFTLSIESSPVHVSSLHLV
ncbi:unnamed protein product, partial [Vitis vinifera]|uniref:Plant bHLH transcription factor ACT-like domain-containing protein n=2 Tax=Vitis vinifera TaxID=29760 RepID=D7TDF8_VITVI